MRRASSESEERILHMLALLGRRDSPTDGVEDYCTNLSDALQKLGYELRLERMPWAESGWISALRREWRRSRSYTGQWTLVQYTALAWSRRGFSFGFLAVLWVLRLRGTRLAVVFHDTQQYAGTRLADRARRLCQLFVMRSAFRLAQASILPVPLEKASWLPPKPLKAAFVPIGANIPAVREPAPASRNGEAKTIVVFTVTDGGDITREVSDLVLAARRAADHVSRVRLVTLGRGSAEAETKFQEALAGSAIEFSALGILPPHEVSQVLARADVSLFVRGRISLQRGSAIASIANGVPLVAYADSSLPAPFAEAGVVGVRYPDGEQLAEATIKVLTDRSWWLELHHRSQQAYEKYFSWEAVAAQCVKFLDHA